MSHLNPQRLWLCYATWQEGLCRWNESYWSVDPKRERKDPDRTGLITEALRDREVSLDESTRRLDGFRVWERPELLWKDPEGNVPPTPCMSLEADSPQGTWLWPCETWSTDISDAPWISHLRNRWVILGVVSGCWVVVIDYELSTAATENRCTEYGLGRRIREAFQGARNIPCCHQLVVTWDTRRVKIH